MDRNATALSPATASERDHSRGWEAGYSDGYYDRAPRFLASASNADSPNDYAIGYVDGYYAAVADLAESRAG